MNDIVKIAQEAGFNITGDLYGEEYLIERLEKFAFLVRFYALQNLNKASEDMGEEL